MTDTNITPMPQKPPIVVLRERLQERKLELKAALTDVDPDHFIRALVTAAQINPELQACSWQSIWNACMKACRDNLLPDGREGAIVPFKSSATWIPMYQGLLKRFRQSGQCKWITADVVRQGEVFEHFVDETGEHFKHIPGTSNGVAPVERVYAAALTKDGAFYVAVMSMAEINKVKAMSRASREDSPWRQWPDEMMKKTVLRRLSKLLPAGRELIEEDYEDEVPGPKPAIAEERAPGAAAALDLFAGPSEPGATEGGEIARTAESVPTDPFSIAYQRGRIAKVAGMQRRAIPGEYREENAKAEAEAWQAGYDGKEFTNPQTGEVLGADHAEGS